MTQTLTSLAAVWWSWIAPLSVQIGILGALVWIIDQPLKKRGWPQVRYALWAVVFVKLVLPPSFALPTSIAAYVLPAEPAVAAIAAVSNAAPRIDRVAQPADLDQLESSFEPSPAPVVAGPTVAAPTLLQFARTNWKAIVMLLWTAGVLTLGLWLIVRLLSIHRLIHNAAVAPEWDGDALNTAAGRIGMKHLPRIVATDRVKSAAVFGLLRPVILVPASWERQCSPTEKTHILLHELAHIKRGDLFLNAVLTFLHVAFWFNPFVWLAGSRMRELGELCCDASVARILGEETASYRDTLIEAGHRVITGRSGFSLGLLGLFENPRRFSQRLEHLARPLWKHPRLRIAVAAAVVVAMVLFVLPMAPLKAAPAKTKAKSANAIRPQMLTTVVTGAPRDTSGNPRTANPSRPGSIHGKVVRANERTSLSGIVVRLQRAGLSTPDVDSTATTGPDGSLVIESVPAGDYVLVANEPEDKLWVYVPWSHVKVEAGKDTQATVEIAFPVVVRGRIVDKATHEPLALGAGGFDAMVQSTDNGVYLSWGLTSDSGEGGAFEVRLAPREWTVGGWLKSDSGSIVRDNESERSVEVKPGGDMTLPDIEVALPHKDAAKDTKPVPARTAKITGVTLDKSGKPVPHVAVTAYSQKETPLPPVSGATGEDGRFSLEVPREKYDEWTLVAKGDGLLAFALALVVPDEPGVDGQITLAPDDGKLVGTVLDDAGNPLKGARVNLRYVSDPTPVPMTLATFERRVWAAEGDFRECPQLLDRYVTSTDASGSYTFTGLPRDFHVGVRVELKGFGTAENSDSFIANGVNNVTRMAIEAKIVGRVVTKISDIRLSGITIYGTVGENGYYQRVTTTTSERGAFFFDALRSGKAGFRLNVPDGSDWTYLSPGSIDLSPGATVQVEIELIRGALVTGRVIDEETGKGVPDMTILGDGSDRGTATDKDGKFSLRLPPGAFKIDPILHSGPVFYWRPTEGSSMPVDVTLEDGQNAALPDFRVISNHITKPKPKTAAEKEKDDADLAAFHEVYNLKSGEDFKLILPPYIPGRLIYYQREDSFQAELIPGGPDEITFRWDGADLKRWGEGFGEWNVQYVIEQVLSIGRETIEGDSAILKTPLPCDTIRRDSASQESLRTGLEAALQKALGKPVRLAFSEVDRKAYVVRGEYHFTALPEYRNGAGSDTIELFGSKRRSEEEGGGGGSGTLDKALQWIARSIGYPVVSEVTRGPSGDISWLDAPLPRDADHKVLKPLPDDEVALILKHVSDQTGLTFAPERRKVRILFVELAKEQSVE